jgi:NTE family protein
MAFELWLKNGRLRLPSGLSPGEGVALVIDRFAAPYGYLKSFDDLPTPFRCLASDLTTGKGVVFDGGSLFDALRATMSLPAFFAPLRKGGRILVDGGLTDNLPVDVVRKISRLCRASPAGRSAT